MEYKLRRYDNETDFNATAHLYTEQGWSLHSLKPTPEGWKEDSCAEWTTQGFLVVWERNTRDGMFQA